MDRQQAAAVLAVDDSGLEQLIALGVIHEIEMVGRRSSICKDSLLTTLS